MLVAISGITAWKCASPISVIAKSAALNLSASVIPVSDFAAASVKHRRAGKENNMDLVRFEASVKASVYMAIAKSLLAAGEINQAFHEVWDKEIQRMENRMICNAIKHKTPERLTTVIEPEKTDCD